EHLAGLHVEGQILDAALAPVELGQALEPQGHLRPAHAPRVRRCDQPAAGVTPTAGSPRQLSRSGRSTSLTLWTTVFCVWITSGRTTRSLSTRPSLSPRTMTGNLALRDSTVIRRFSWLAICTRCVNGPESTCFPVTLAFGITW